jgi:hypothetical protein
VFASLQTASQLNGSIPVTGVSATGSVATLKSVVSKTASGGFGIFAGKYGYVYSEAGLQIVAWVSSPSEAAVRGTFRAY